MRLLWRHISQEDMDVKDIISQFGKKLTRFHSKVKSMNVLPLKLMLAS